MRGAGHVLRYQAKHLKGAVRQAEARVTRRWNAVSPDSFEAARRVLGRDQSDPANQPLPEFGSVFEDEGIRMRIDPRMAEENVRKLVAGEHTRQERTILAEILEPDDVVMELGGGIGMVAITCAKVVGSENVTVYEANPEIESLARDNYALNDVSPTLHICMMGLEAGSRTFHLSERFSRSYVFAETQGMRTVEVPVRPFGEEAARVRPSLLIVDIQGAEVEFLDYADLSSIRKLLIEFHPSMTGFGPIKSMRRRIRQHHGMREVMRVGNSFVYER